MIQHFLVCTPRFQLPRKIIKFDLHPVEKNYLPTDWTKMLFIFRRGFYSLQASTVEDTLAPVGFASSIIALAHSFEVLFWPTSNELSLSAVS